MSNSGQFEKGHKPWNKGKKRPDITGVKHPMYKGGSITVQGYKVICINGKQVLEHRYFMEQHINRKLERREHIHHINGIKTDNRIENLELVDWSEHGKQHATRQWKTGGSLRKRFE